MSDQYPAVPSGRPAEVVVPQSTLDPQAAKAQLRARVRAQRALRTPEERALLDAARTESALSLVGDTSCVATYLSVGDEPATLDLVERLHGNGIRVLVPLLKGRRSPAWAAYPGRDGLAPGLWDIPEPVDAAEVPLSEAGLVLASGLAATPDGRRLGVGGGWFDRALPTRGDGVPVWVLLHADEIFSDLPAQPHDVRVNGAVTEQGLSTFG